MENPFDLGLPPALVASRFVCAALCICAVATGSRLLAWLSVPVLLWALVVVWGRHVLFLESLHALPWLRPGAASNQCAERLPGVSVIAPARNEEMGIEAAMRSLALLDYPSFEVLAIDDHSTDATPEILRRLAAEFSRVRVIHAPALPDGWAGKPHASWCGFRQADPATEWLLFTDARVVFHPDAVRQVVAHALAEGLDFLSCILRFDGATVAEGLLAASQNRALVTASRNFRGGDPKVPFALGAFTLIRRSLYAATGGHSVFRSHPIEDFMLARLAKRSGARISVAIACDLVSLRRYHGFADMRRRIPRGLRAAASDRIPNLVDRIGIETILNAAPFCLALAGLARLWASHRWEPVFLLFSLLAFLGYLAGVFSFRSCAAVSRFPRVVPWLQPAGAFLWIWFALEAIGECLRGKPLRWRDRTVLLPTPKDRV